MKVERRKLAIILLLSLALTSFALVYAIPQPPHKFYGSVTVGGVAAPDGTIVLAKIDGTLYEATTTTGGAYGWDPMFNVPADDTDTGPVEGGVTGDTIEFYVNGIYATSYTFAVGGMTQLNLEITVDAYEIQLYAGWNLIGIPFIPVNPSIEVMLSNILLHVEAVWAYDGDTGFWSSYRPGAPSDLSEIIDGRGYWIKMPSDMVWVTTSP